MIKVILSFLFLFQFTAFLSTALIAGAFFLLKRNTRKKQETGNRRTLLVLCIGAELLSQFVLFIICWLWFDFFTLSGWLYVFAVLSLLSLAGFFCQYHFVKKAANKDLQELFQEEKSHHIYE